MLFNWPSYFDSATGTRSFYDVDYKQLAEKCGLAFSKKIFISPPEIKSSSPPTFHNEFQMALDSLLKLLKDELSKKERPWSLYPKVAKVIDNIVEYVKIEGYYLRTVPAETLHVQASPSFSFIIQRLVRLTKDLHLLCKYTREKKEYEFKDIRRILRDVIRALRERCEKFIQAYSNGSFEFGDNATMVEIREMLIAQYLQLAKLLWNFTKYNDHKIYVEKSCSGMSFYDGKAHDIWALMDSSVKQVENGGSSVSPVTQKRELIKKLHNFPQNGSMNTVSDLASLNDVLVRRKGSNNDESQPSARISYNGSINDLGGLSSFSTRPSMVNIERRRTADNNDRPVGLTRGIKSSHEAGEGGNEQLVKGLRRSNSIQEKKVSGSGSGSGGGGITGREPVVGLEDVSELDSSIENGSPKRARNYLDREIRKTKDLWEMVGETGGAGPGAAGAASLTGVDSLVLPSKIVIEEEDDDGDVKIERKERSMTQILFMKSAAAAAANQDDTVEKEEKPKESTKPSKRVSVVADKRLKLMTMVNEPEPTVMTPPRLLNLNEEVEQNEQQQQEEEEEITPIRKSKLQRGKTMIENTEYEECESPWISPSPSPVKGRFVFKPEEIQEVNEDDSPTAHRKKSDSQQRNGGFVRRSKRRNSTSMIAGSSQSPRRTTVVQKEKETMLRERRREKQGYCYQKKFQNERRQDFLSKIFGDQKQIIQRYFEDSHGLDVNRVEKENKKPLVRQETEEFHLCPVKNMSRLADVPVTISESLNFFNKLKVEKHEEAKGKNKRKHRLELWKRGRDAMKARDFMESLQEEEDALSPTVNRNHKRQTLDLCHQGINNTLKSFRYKKTTFVGPLRKAKECNKIMEPARGYFMSQKKTSIDRTDDLEISLMLARLAFGKRIHRISDDRSMDDSMNNSGSGFSFKKRRSFFRSLFSQSPSGGDSNNNSPRSDRSRSDSRDYGPAPASATKPSLFKSLFRLNPLDINVLSPKTRGRSNSIESVKDNSGSSPSPNHRNQSSFSAHKRPSLFKSLFKLSFFDRDGEKSSPASDPRTADWLDPGTPSPSELDSPSLRKSRSEHKRVDRRFY